MSGHKKTKKRLKGKDKAKKKEALTMKQKNKESESGNAHEKTVLVPAGWHQQGDAVQENTGWGRIMGQTVSESTKSQDD